MHDSSGTSGGCECTRSAGAAQRVRLRAAPCGLALSLGLWLLAPKCPMCLAVYLSFLGIGGGVAAYAHPFLRPASFALVALALAAVLFQGMRRRSARAAARAR